MAKVYCYLIPSATSWRFTRFSTWHFDERLLLDPGFAGGLNSYLYAWSDELHQLLIPSRSPNPTDVAIVFAGVMIGVLIMWAFVMLRRKKNEKTSNLVQIAVH